jgi:hypothetical protein
MDAPTSWLNLKLLAPLLEGGQPLLGVAGQVNVHARSHTCHMVFYHEQNKNFPQSDYGDFDIKVPENCGSE